MYPDNQNNQPAPSAPVTPPQEPQQPQPPTQPSFTPPAGPQMPPSAPQPPAPKRASKLPILIVAGLVIIGVVAVAVYMLLPKTNSANSNNDTSGTQTTASTQSTPVTSLHSAKLVGPDMSGYTLAMDSPTSKQYAKGNCNIVYGVTTAVELPGSTYDDIITKRLASYSTQGITANASAGTTLLLKDSNDSSKQYSLQTTTFTAISGTTHVLAYYSIAIMGDGTRAFVTRACNNNGSDVQPSAMTDIESKARGVTITPQ
jgi:hypothetical protein